MMITELQDSPDQSLPQPQGHVIGFIDSRSLCEAFAATLNESGIPLSKLSVFGGEFGKEQFTEMMNGSLWGETAEKLLKEGVIAIEQGQIVIAIQAEDRDEALKIARISEQYGGHGFRYFGQLADERLSN